MTTRHTESLQVNVCTHYITSCTHLHSCVIRTAERQFITAVEQKQLLQWILNTFSLCGSTYVLSICFAAVQSFKVHETPIGGSNSKKKTTKTAGVLFIVAVLSNILAMHFFFHFITVHTIKSGIFTHPICVRQLFLQNERPGLYEWENSGPTHKTWFSNSCHPLWESPSYPDCVPSLPYETMERVWLLIMFIQDRVIIAVCKSSFKYKLQALYSLRLTTLNIHLFKKGSCQMCLHCRFQSSIFLPHHFTHCSFLLSFSLIIFLSEKQMWMSLCVCIQFLWLKACVLVCLRERERERS